MAEEKITKTDLIIEGVEATTRQAAKIGKLSQKLNAAEARIKELEAELKAYREGIPIEEHHKDGREFWVGEKGDPWGSYFWCDKPNYWGEIGWQEECNRVDGYISHHPVKPTHIFHPLPQEPKEEE